MTLEPCLMCMGAIVLARIERLVFGALTRRQAAGSLYDISKDKRLNQGRGDDRVMVRNRQLLKDFFLL